MQVTVKPIKEKSQAELTVLIPAKDFAPYIERAAKGLTKDKPMPGFRPGKAPLAAVIGAFGKERVLHEAMDKALPHFFVQAALDQGVDAINRPSIAITKLDMNEPFEFSATVDVLPEVSLGNLKNLKVESKDVTVSEEEVERELKQIAKMRAKTLEVVRPAQTGDLVTVDFTVKMNGAVIPGGESKNHPVQVGEGQFVPDFEKNLLGITAGEERAFEMGFPEDFTTKDLAGKKAQVNVKAHSVAQMVLPEIDDAFAKSVGKFESAADLRQKLKDNIAHDKEHKESDRRRGKLMEQLSAQASFGFIPEVLLEREIDSRLQELAQMLTLQNRSVEDYLQKQKKTLKDLRADMRSAAEKAVKIGLAMRAFAKEQKIEISDEEIEAQATEYLARHGDPKTAAEKTDLGELRENITLVLRNRKALDRLEEIAQGAKKEKRQ